MRGFTIAMAVLTAALFGYALFETLRPGPSGDELACEALAPQIAEFDALETAKREHLKDLAGAEIGTAGARFAAVRIGETATLDQIDSAQHTTTPTSTDPYAMWVSDTNGTITRIEIRLGSYDETPCDKTDDDPCACKFESHDRALCDDFGKQLASAWGAPKDGAWVNATTGRHASFTGCTLVFE